MSTIPPELLDPFFVENRLQDYLDGELNEEEVAFVEAGLQKYPDLQIQLEALRYSKDIFRSELMVEPPEHLLSQIEAAVEEEPAQVKSYQVPMLILVAAAVLLIFLIPENDNQWSKDVASAQSIQATPIDLPLDIIEDSIPNEKISLPTIEKPKLDIKSPTQDKTASKTPRKQKTQKRKVRLYSSDTPVAEIYIPDDEKDAYAAADNYLSAKQDLQEHSKIQTTNTNLLYDLQKSAQEQGFVVLTPNNKNLKPYVLSQDRPFQIITLQFRSEQWSAVNQMVTNMGGTVGFSSAELQQGDNSIDIEISYWHTP